MPIIECVPNFSEGQNAIVIQKIADAIASVQGVKLLHRDSGHSAHRTVYTFAGEMEMVFSAAYRAIEVASEWIDMRKHNGEHPRIGACDVCPFVPISGITVEELVPYTLQFAEKVSKDFNIPIFLYEHSASDPARRNLAKHRIGNYEALNDRMKDGIAVPDYGHSFNPTFGGMVCGARPFLVAYNVNLDTTDVNIAKEIAYDLRELGRPFIDEQGKKKFRKGLMPAVKAIGWYIPEFKMAQVSINIVDFKRAPIHEVFENCKVLAQKYGVETRGSELIGLIPKEAILVAGSFYSEGKMLSDEDKIKTAIKQMGLNYLVPFDPNKRLLEYVLNKN